MCEHCRVRHGAEISISYLPLNHGAGQLFDIYMPLYSGTTVHFAQPDALKVCNCNAENHKYFDNLYGSVLVWYCMGRK